MQGKWKEVAEDLRRKCDEIEVLLQSDYTTQDHRVMSPLDKDALVSLKNQLQSLRGPLHVRRELLQEAYSSWGNVEGYVKSLSVNMLNVEFARAGTRPPESGWAVRPLLEHVAELREGEVDLVEQGEQLQTLVQHISDLPTVLIDTTSVVKERETLLNKHTVLCKRASNKRIKSQRACLKLEPVIPFLRGCYLDRLSWLYNQPLPDIDSRRETTTTNIVATLSRNPKNVKNVRYSQYWHALKTIAPEKIPLMLLHWFAFAFGPFGMGCSTDRPLMISEFTPDILI